MKETQGSWFQNKFVNPRSREGKPETERLRYLREFLESFVMKDPRFSGATIVGSTMKGNGLESSDIDIVLFYYEIHKEDRISQQKNWGMNAPDFFTSTNFLGDFSFSKAEFELVKAADPNGGKTFYIDLRPNKHNLSEWFKVDPLGEVTISIENLLKCGDILLHDLSHPIIATKNLHAFMPMKKVFDAIRKTIAEASKEQKVELLRKILERFKKYIKISERKDFTINETVDEKQYTESRMKMLEQQLKIKFGLYV